MSVGRVRQLSRFVVLAAIGGLAGGCSSDSMRFAGNPFSNPFASKSDAGEPRMTGSLAPAPRMAVQSQPLPAPRQAAAPAYAPYTPPKPTSPAASSQAVTSGSGGWTAQGGTAVTIGEGENLNVVANRYGVPASAVLSANGLRSAAQVGPGQQVIIPVYNAAGVQSASVQPVASQPKSRIDLSKSGQADTARQPFRSGQSFAGSVPTRSQPVPEPQKMARAEVQPLPQPKLSAPAKQEPVQKEPEQTASLPPSGGAEFRWPARGRVISGFGSAGNEGINIAVPEGTPVKAAETGTVAYAGSEVKGYGNLVLIRHDNGFVSAYAHNGEIAVKRGDRVKRGQVVAKSGQSGNVTSPQLHFEIRKGSTPVDPLPHLEAN
jgi:murein DD-endopeptidase MepM/ murein hydrolase activator NlpD